MFTSALLALALAADPKPRLDADGVPLPNEAVQRLGSARFLVNRFTAAAFSPDGKTVYTVSEEDSSDWRQPYTSPGLVAWEVPSGKKLWQAGMDRRLEQVVADPDGKSVWVLEREKAKGEGEPDQLQRVRHSTKDGKELARGPRIEGFSQPSLHPTGLTATTKSLAIEKQNEDPDYVQWVSVVDREGEGIDIRPFEPKTPGFNHQFLWSPTADRLFVITGATDHFRCLTATDVTLKKQLWSITNDAIGGWCVAPDGKSVVVVTQKGNGETVYARRLDAKTGKELGGVEVKGVNGMGDIFGGMLNERGLIHFHPDGKTLYLIDEDDRTVAIDVASWKTVPTKVKLARYTVFSPEGKMTLAPDGRHVVIREPETGKRLSPHDGGMSQPDHNTQLQFSPKSDRVTRKGWIRKPELEWEVFTGRETSRTNEKDTPKSAGEYCVTLSADGQTKAVLTEKDDEWRFTVTHPDKPKDPPVALKAGWGKAALPYRWVSFTLDARHLVAAGPQYGFHVWDTKTGERRAEVKYQDAGFQGLCSDGMQISPNGRWVAVPERGRPFAKFVPPADKWTWQLGVYEIPSGKLVHRFEGNGDLEAYRWIDDRLAALATFPAIGSPLGARFTTPGGKSQLVWMDPSVTSKRATPIDPDVRAWAASPFGDSVAVGSSDGLRLYEASTGKLRHTFREQKRPVEVLAFSPNGRYLAAESVDGPLLVWDVRGDLTKPAKPDAAGWVRVWEALGNTDAEKAFAAVRLIAAYPDDGVTQLKRRFAEGKPTADEIATAIRKLDDRDFATREQAERQLRAMGTEAFPAINKAMEREPSQEFKQRAERLLAVDIPADRRRAERAVEAVRLADTDAARKLLAEWAKGPADSPLTAAAKR